jgi:signal transduction histidine kinase
MVTKKEKILSNQDKLLDAMLNKDEHALRKLIHPEATVFGSAINEFEKGIDRVIHYYTQSIALLPDDRRIEVRWRNFSDLGDNALVEQEFIIHFTLEDQEITLLTLRQSALWTRVPQEKDQDDQWLLLHDHTSMPDHLGAFETISSSEMLESNLNLELETDQLKKQLIQTLSELNIVKDQLVQKERLASIGQLTAGIAHEIKNPLNFVNNFSEVILELIDEAREEVLSEKGKVKSEKESPFEGGNKRSEQGDDKNLANSKGSELDLNSTNTPLNPLSRGDLILEILDDIEMNLKKIHEHGTRADGIVKSMLQHSRGGSGKMEPTDINDMIKEFVNLSFHGMRASKNPINVDIDLQLDKNVGEVPLIAEDFSRVILNLTNNAFDAMREKTLQGFGTLGGLENYLPKLTVRTLQKNSNITIEIKDNGPGIPDELKDKILQPFFTTKKGTQGTGLGLSITNDIVKAHGGSLDIHSESGKFTQFRITIPVKHHE